MNDNDPWHIDESELPEWLQREAEAIREQQAMDRLKIAVAAWAITIAGLLAILAIYRAWRLG